MLAHRTPRGLAVRLIASPLLALALQLVLVSAVAACGGGAGFPGQR